MDFGDIMMTEEEKNKLKQDIKDDHTATAEELLKIKYEHPVSAPSEEYPHVGNWYLTGTDISNATLKKELREISQKHPDKLISHNAIELHQINSKKDDIESLSRYSTSTKKIRLHTYGEEYKQDLLKDEDLHPLSHSYIKGDPIAVQGALIHETVHRDHDIIDGSENFYSSPYYTCRVERLTETTANAAQYLAAARQYTFLKQNNINNIQFNGEEYPIEKIISSYPGLKEYIEANGFDINNPQNIKGVVSVSSQFWHEERQEIYDKSSYAKSRFCGSTEGIEPTFSTLLANTSAERLAKKYETTSSEMLKDVYIGYNTTVDLTDCRELLDTVDEKHSDFLEKQLDKNKIIKAYAAQSEEELLEINTHLESLGLKTDDQKDEYMQNFIKNVTCRDGVVDEKLKQIVLSYEKYITYADGLTASYEANKTTIYDEQTHITIPDTQQTSTNQKKHSFTATQLASLKARNDR